jgi:hypothetical protein
MRIKYFEEYINEGKSAKVVYHGTPFRFEGAFKNTTTFFSDTARFAYEYAQSKSMHNEMDASITILQCEMHANLFDINDPDSCAKLRSALPETVKLRTVHGFVEYTMERESLLRHMQGVVITDPEIDPSQTFVGDVVTMNETDYVVLTKHPEHVMVYKMDDLESVLEQGIRERPSRVHSYEKYYDFVLPLGAEYAGATTMSQCNDIMDKWRKLLIQKLAEDGAGYKKTTVSVEEELRDTWMYFENPTVIGAIQGMGYDGYTAKEERKNTHAIFNPNTCIRILNKGVF